MQKLSVLKLLLNPSWVDVLHRVWKSGRRFFQPHGMYEVLEFDARLELLDEKGKKAVYYKRQRVRFLQDNIIAYQDQAWGDGDIFADYKCSPGVPVDRYQEGNRYRVLISLRETKNYGDIEEFHIERRIKNGFTKSESYFQNKIDHRTRRISVSVIFPKARPPRQTALIEHNANHTTPLEASYIQTLPDGRTRVVWRSTKPRLFETYSIRWQW